MRRRGGFDDRRNQQGITEHPGSCFIFGARVVRENPEQRSIDSDACFCGRVRIRVDVGKKLVAQPYCTFCSSLGDRAINPWLTLFIQFAVDAKDRNEGSKFHPASVVFRCGVTKRTLRCPCSSTAHRGQVWIAFVGVHTPCS